MISHKREILTFLLVLVMMANNRNTSVNYRGGIEISRHKVEDSTFLTSMNSFSLLGRCRKFNVRMKDAVVPVFDVLMRLENTSLTENEEYIPQTIHRSQIISIHNDNPDIKGTVRVGCNQIPCTSLSSQTVQILIVWTHSSSQKFHELRRGRGEKRDRLSEECVPNIRNMIHTTAH